MFELEPRTFRLRPDQFEFLRTLDDPSEWVREAIDKCRYLKEVEEGTPEGKIIALAHLKDGLLEDLRGMDYDDVFRSARTIFDKEKELKQKIRDIETFVPRIKSLRDELEGKRIINIQRDKQRIILKSSEGSIVTVETDVGGMVVDEKHVERQLNNFRRTRSSDSLENIKSRINRKCSLRLNIQYS